eukprot:TRINITY_DN23399_c0_g1_i1.p1 TRINITY_DN23399_c0_g1~~TRINITY_DN23399_c0_g1_i1.p1  ORF type:complete len:290 (-),score=36.95 TRINITY_DN23399_c0_g1_i1:71-940(-)
MSQDAGPRSNCQSYLRRLRWRRLSFAALLLLIVLHSPRCAMQALVISPRRVLPCMHLLQNKHYDGRVVHIFSHPWLGRREQGDSRARSSRPGTIDRRKAFMLSRCVGTLRPGSVRIAALMRRGKLIGCSATPGQLAAKQAEEAKDRELPSRSIAIEDVHFQYSRSSGPGGQNVNKVETKVEARFDVAASKFLPEWVKDNLRVQEANRFNNDGILIVTSEEHRTRQDNTKAVMQKLHVMIQSASFIPKGPDKSKLKKMQAKKKAANEKRLEDKKFKSNMMKKRQEARRRD